MQRTVARSRLRSVLRVGAPLLLIGLLAGCLLPPEPETEAGKDVFNLYVVVLILAAIVFVGGRGLHPLRDRPLPTQARRRHAAGAAPRQHDGRDHLDPHPDRHRLHPVRGEHGELGGGGGALRRPRRRHRGRGLPVELDLPIRGRPGRGPAGRRATGPRRAGRRAGTPRAQLARREPRLLRAAVPHQARPHRLRRERARQRARVHDHRGGHLRRPVRRVLRHVARRHDVRRRRDATRATTTPTSRRWSRARRRRRRRGGECATTIEIKADNIAFDIDSFEVPAEQDFCIEFENQEDVPHNVAIYDGGEALFTGEIADRAGSITYHVPALPAGRVSVHLRLPPAGRWWAT